MELKIEVRCALIRVLEIKLPYCALYMQCFKKKLSKLISGQQLCPYWKKCRSVCVEIHTYGIPADTGTMATPAVVC